MKLDLSQREILALLDAVAFMFNSERQQGIEDELIEAEKKLMVALDEK